MVYGDIPLKWRLEGKMIEIGRLCVKIAGRDAGLKCIVVDILKDKFVLIDGETRRRKCNILHLEPLKNVIKISKNASHEEVEKEFEKLGLKARKSKPKAKTTRPRKKRKTAEQLKEQKDEKKKERKKLREMFGVGKKKEEKKVKGESLEEKAGLVEENKGIKNKGAKKNSKPSKK